MNPSRSTSSPLDARVADDGVSERLRELVLLVAELTGTDPHEFRDGAQPRHVVRALWDRLMAHLAVPGAAMRVEAMASALARIRELEQQLDERELLQGTELLGRVRSALGTLRAARTVDDLFGRAAIAACSLGFDRALLSVVDENTWRLHSMHVDHDARWAEEILAVGREASPVLDAGIVEHDVLVEGDAVLVHDVQENWRVNRPLAQITRSDSYGIAPLAMDGRIVGLVHGDCYHQRRRLNERDRALLGLFAEGVSHTLGRVVVLERLEGIRAGLADLSLPSVPSQAAAPVAEGPTQAHALLTRRENEIMQLLANGDANRMIARRLSITEGTAKCHVTSILRKLGASNRAEAVSIWLRAR
jgi:DNA-binding CsgD family transcriptional regulator